MKFLIFGGTGFVGDALKKYIISRGGEAMTVSRSAGKAAFAVDIAEKANFSVIDYEPDVVVNCASRVPAKGISSTDPEFLKELFLTNVIGGANIADWAVRKNVKRIINCSTLVVVKKPWPNPLTEEHSRIPDGFHVGYSMSKLSQEQIMNQYVTGGKTELVHARLSAVYGEEMVPEGIIFSILESLRKDREVRLYDADKNSMDLVHVEDVARSIISIAEAPSLSWNTINIASGNEVSVLQLVEELKRLTGSQSEIINSNTENPPSRAQIDVEKLRSVIGNRFEEYTPLEKGLRGIVDNLTGI